MLKGFLFTLLVISSLNIVSAEIRINEVMYDPTCPYDTHCEWIEIYNNGINSINMTNWIISDGDANDTLEGYDSMIIPGNTYALIVDDDTRIYNEFEIGSNIVWLYTGDDTIGDKLSNDDEVILYDENANLIADIDYGEVDTGNTWALINGTWQEALPTPGRDNVENITYANDYSKIRISEFLPDPEGEDNALIPNGEWVELYNSGNYDLDLLGFYFKDNNGNDADLIITNTTTGGGTIINSKKYLTIYTNGISGFLNNDGLEKISFYDLDNNLIDSVSYSESDEGVSWSLSEDRWQKTSPTKNGGNLDNKTSIQSEIRIEEIYDLGDGKAEWGDIIRAKLFVYKGNTNKEVVWVWVEDSEGERVTKKSKFNIYERFVNYTFTYPIQLPDNCEDSFKDGNGNIKIEGLDASDELILEIREKPLCKDGTRKPRVKEFEYEVLEYPDSIKEKEEFSTKIKLKNNGEEELKVELWSYVYSGKKQYVKENELENMETVILKSEEEKTVELKNNVEGIASSTSPRLKINILKEDLKNPYSVTKELKIEKSESVKKGLKEVTGEVIYESRGVEANKSAIFFFSGLMMSLSIYMFWRKWN